MPKNWGDAAEISGTKEAFTMKAMKRVIVGICAAVGSIAGAGPGDSPYIRVVDEDAGTVRLDVAVRTLVSDTGEGPLVNLVGAIHIGDREFYDAVQALLDVHDVVLYEGVGGGRPAGEEPDAGAAAAAVATERRERFLWVLAEDVRRREGEYPGSAEALAEASPDMGGMISGALVDGWGEPLRFVRTEKSLDLVSLGADGREGGSGLASDIRASDVLARERVVTNAGESEGLQRDLADALGLIFQMDGIDYSGAHWRNSDLSIGEIQEALGGGERLDEAGAGGDPAPIDPDAPEGLKAADMLFRTLSGESFLAKVSGFLMKRVGSSPGGRAMVKIMLADTLTHAEDLLAMQPGGLADLMKVIVEDRNSVVVRDLREVVDKEPGVRTIAVFYGAGHFGDLEQRICDELGYRYESTLWVPAMTIDAAEAGLGAEQVRFFRKIVGDMMEAQIKAAGRRAE